MPSVDAQVECDVCVSLAQRDANIAVLPATDTCSLCGTLLCPLHSHPLRYFPGQGCPTCRGPRPCDLCSKHSGRVEWHCSKCGAAICLRHSRDPYLTHGKVVCLLCA
jgi:hypothetical protein